MRPSYRQGLHELGDGVFAYLQPDGGWGWSNAGLVSDGEATLLVDTLFDLSLTAEMLEQMRAAVPAAARIGTLVNTHANGDHCFGNQLVAEARIVASAEAAAEMAELPPEAMAGLVRQAPELGELGEFFLRCFGGFEFAGIELRLPDQTFSGELELEVGGQRVRLLELGPAHTRGDTVAFLPERGVLYAGDLLFNGSHPIAWAGPLEHWIEALDRILALAPQTVVPGHGPLAGVAEVREQRAYLEHVLGHARRCHGDGMTPLQAARAMSLDRWVDWGERERLVVNIASAYADLEHGAPALTPLAAFQQMAELAAG